MRIEKLDIKGFGGLTPAVREPHPGMNIIHGPNESGKSTLMAFIQAMLFGLKGGRSGREGVPASLRRYAPWLGGPYAGILEYVCDDGRRFRVGRNFEKNMVNVHDEHVNNITGSFPLDRETGPGFAESHLGVDADTFTRTLFIPQMGAALDGTSRRLLHEKLVRFNTAGDEELSLDKALTALRRAMMEQVGSERSTTRPLDRLTARIRQLEEEFRSERDRLDGYMGMLTARADQRERVEAVRAELVRLREAEHRVDDLQRQQECWNRLKGLEKILAELTAAELQLKESVQAEVLLKEHLKRLEPLDRFHAEDPKRVQELPVDFGRLTAVLETLERTDRKLKEENEVYRAFGAEADQELQLLADADETDLLICEWNDAQEVLGGTSERNRLLGALRDGSKKPFGGISLFLMVLSLLSLVVFGAGQGLSNPQLALSGVIGLVIALPALGIVLLLQNRAWSRRVEDSGPEQHWRDISQKMNGILTKTGAKSVPELIRLRQQAESRVGRLRALKRSVGQIEDERRSLTEEKFMLESRIRRVLEVAAIPAGVDLTGREIASFTELRDALFADKTALGATEREIAGIEEGIRSLYREAAVLTGRKPTTMPDARDLLDKAQGEWERMQSKTGRRGGPESGMAAGTDGGASMNDPVSPETLAAEITRLSEEEYRQSLALRELETRLEDMPREERLQEIAEELGRLREREQALTAHAAALELAIGGLETAAQIVKHDFAPRFNADVGRIMGRLTGERHASIRADDRFALHVEAPGATEVVPVQLLSGGTVDQAYLAMRLAAVLQLESDGERLPIFLDEPFAQYDETRMRHALELFHEMSAERQIFLFTCKERERDAALEIFGMDGAAVWEL